MSSDQITTDLTEFVNWRRFIFGSYTVHEIICAVDSLRWQVVRREMKGEDLRFKYNCLVDYINDSKTGQGGVPHDVKVQVTNYVFALKRGGLIG